MDCVSPTANNETGREIVRSRMLDAPRELVFEAWTNPKHVAEWSDPNGFPTTIHETKVKPGGICRFSMHGPDGVNYPNKVVYIDVVPRERLVYIHGDDDGAGAGQFHVTVTFEDRDG